MWSKHRLLGGGVRAAKGACGKEAPGSSAFALAPYNVSKRIQLPGVFDAAMSTHFPRFDYGTSSTRLVCMGVRGLACRTNRARRCAASVSIVHRRLRPVRSENSRPRGIAGRERTASPQGRQASQAVLGSRRSSGGWPERAARELHGSITPMGTKSQVSNRPNRPGRRTALSAMVYRHSGPATYICGVMAPCHPQ